MLEHNILARWAANRVVSSITMAAGSIGYIMLSAWLLLLQRHNGRPDIVRSTGALARALCRLLSSLVILTAVAVAYPMMAVSGPKKL